MLRESKLKLLWTVIAFYTVFTSVEIGLPNPKIGLWLNSSEAAHAKSTGGRGRGGSFKKSSTSTPSRSSNSSSSSSSSVSIYHSSSSGDTIILPTWANLVLTVCFALLILTMVFLAVFSVWTKLQGNSRQNASSDNRERDNDTVTVSKIQVALLAQAHSIQSQLSELSLNVNTETSDGLLQLLQGSALALLYNLENWTHVSASSQTVHRDQAEPIFNKISLQQRSNLSAETLTNVNGQIRQQQPAIPNPEEVGAYIVVTLLIGTADDRPLFTEVRTADALKAALEKVGSMRSDYLMVFELIWSPQVETDTLTYDELLTEYTNMAQIQ